MAALHEQELARRIADDLIEGYLASSQSIGATASLRTSIAAALIDAREDEREAWESGVARLLLHAPLDCGLHMNLAKIGERIAEESRREGVIAGRAEAFAACWAEIKANDAISALDLHEIEVAVSMNLTAAAARAAIFGAQVLEPIVGKIYRRAADVARDALQARVQRLEKVLKAIASAAPTHKRNGIAWLMQIVPWMQAQAGEALAEEKVKVVICARCGGLGRVHEGYRHRQGDCRDVDQCPAWKACPCTETTEDARKSKGGPRAE